MSPINRGAVIAAALLLALLGLTAAVGPTRIPTAAAQDKPNIVVFLLDDTNPIDNRLWSNPTLTPNIYDLFVAQGIHFSNAFGETPLCCPSRATLLTGLHTQNHGVFVNDGTLFNPGETLAKELHNAGYHTMIAGKYLNKIFSFTPDDWAEHEVGWDDMDVFSNDQRLEDARLYYHYDVHSIDGTVTHYDDLHSTRFVTETTVTHLREVPAESPLFALMSIYNTHNPHIPMPEFATDPRCDSMPPWRPQNYNEADISDKPAYVRAHAAFQPRDGYPMIGICREMLGVDWMVGQTVQELTLEGRLDNTVFVFLADNGMTWGEHRLPQNKNTPYATPIPIYMHWGAGWGTDARDIDEYVSDIDFAPTLCDIGGCALGPFPNGQPKPDGVSLLPVIDGALNGLPAHLGRDAILQSNFEVPWWGIRTTPDSSLGLWAYTEWSNGDRELYDMTNDPWQLQNLASDPAYRSLRGELARRLMQLKAEGRPVGLPTTVTIVETSVPTNKQDFAFSGDLGSFTLDQDSDPTLPRKTTITGLAPGTYTVTQAKVPAWTLKTISCAGADISVSSGTAVIYVQNGDALTCTFTNVKRRPDLSIALSASGPYKGDNYYSATPVKAQTQRRDLVEPGFEYDYLVSVQNDGKLADAFTIGASVTGSATVTASFWSGTTDITGDVLAGSFRTSSLLPGAKTTLVLRVMVAAEAVAGDKQTVVISGQSVAEPVAVDVVRAVTTR